MQPNYFIGQDGFTWFIGVCEDRDVNLVTLLRIRVRAFGYHSDDLTKLPHKICHIASCSSPTFA